MDLSLIRENQSFKSVKEMDNHIQAYLKNHKGQLSEGNRKVITFISRHSVKYPGVSFAKIETIMKETGLSKSTVVRSLNRFVETKLILRMKTSKPNGKQGCNLLVIQPQDSLFLPDRDTPDDTPHATPLKPSEPTYDKASNNNLSKETNSKLVINENHCKYVHKMDVSYLPSYIPPSFAQLAQSFLSLKDVERIWRSVRVAYSKVNLRSEVESYVEKVIATFKQSIYTYKSGGVKKEFGGYFYGGVLNMFNEEVRREVLEDPETVYYDWLNKA